MFLLYAVLAGVVIGLLAGGRASGLARLEFRWAPLVLLGFATQVVLFSEPISDRVGQLGPAIYVGSTGLVLLAVLRNLRITGLPLVALGSISNLVAIVANGGYMPAAAVAKAALGRGAPTTYSNSAILESPNLAPLTDIFTMPAWLPFANVFSVGDLLIGVGVAVAIAAALRSGAVGAPRNLPREPAPD
jgi:hypothetical protein